jgi:hypothetical protein
MQQRLHGGGVPLSKGRLGHSRPPFFLLVIPALSRDPPSPARLPKPPNGRFGWKADIRCAARRTVDSGHRLLARLTIVAMNCLVVSLREGASAVLWKLYFGPYEIIRLSPVRSWIPGVSREFSKRLVGILVLSLLTFLIGFGLYHRFVSDEPLPAAPYSVMILLWGACLLNWFLLTVVAPGKSSVAIRSASGAIYAVLLALAFTG